MEGELFLRELIFILINFPDIDGLTIHIDDEFLIRVDFVLLERSDSYHDLDAVSFTGHVFGLAGFIYMKSNKNYAIKVLYLVIRTK
jgi:hypothetical protein